MRNVSDLVVCTASSFLEIHMSTGFVNDSSKRTKRNFSEFKQTWCSSRSEMFNILNSILKGSFEKLSEKINSIVFHWRILAFVELISCISPIFMKRLEPFFKLCRDKDAEALQHWLGYHIIPGMFWRCNAPDHRAGSSDPEDISISDLDGKILLCLIDGESSSSKWP